MDDEHLNREGYADLTPRMAIRNMEKEKRGTFGFRPVAYICSPYAGDTEGNAQKARRYSRFAVDRGAIPFAPHLLMPQYMDDSDPDERSLALFMGLVMLDKCAEIWVFGDTVTAGMQAEIARARAKGKAVRHFTEDLKESAEWN
jgi:hypothetical protein